MELPTDFLSLGRGSVTMHCALFIHIYTYSYVFTILYVFTISRENPTKSRDFGTHA